MNSIKNLLLPAIFCMAICLHNGIPAKGTGFTPQPEFVTTQKPGETSQPNFAQRQAITVRDNLGKVTGMDNRGIIDTLARTKGMNKIQQNKENQVRYDAAVDGFEMRQFTPAKKATQSFVDQPNITTQPRENLNVRINPDADNVGDITFDPAPEAAETSKNNLETQAHRDVASGIEIYNDIHKSESNPSLNDVGVLGLPVFTPRAPKNQSSRAAIQSSRQPLTKSDSIIDLTRPSLTKSDSIIDLTEPSLTKSDSIINNNNDLYLAHLLSDGAVEPSAQQPKPQELQATAEPAQSQPTSLADSRLMRLNSEGAFVDANGNPLGVEKYVQGKKNNFVPAWLKEQPLDLVTKLNDSRFNTTTTRVLDTRNNTTYETVKNNKTGIAITTWPKESDGYSRQVVKNKIGNATETVNYQSPSDKVSNITNTEMTNYKVYDINNPQNNLQPGNLISSIKISNNYMNYKLYTNDGSGNYTSYTLYTEKFFDKASNTQFSKGDIKIESSDRNQKSLYIKNDGSPDYLQWKNKARDVAEHINQQFVVHAITTPIAQTTAIPEVTSINADGTLAPTATPIAPGQHFTLDPLTFKPVTTEQADALVQENSTVPSFNKNGTPITPPKSATLKNTVFDQNGRTIPDTTLTPTMPVTKAESINSLNELVQQRVLKKITPMLDEASQKNMGQTVDSATINVLKTMNTDNLILLLFYAPKEATAEQPASRSRVWSAINSNIVDNLGIAQKFMSAPIQRISQAASKTLDAILGSKETDGVKQTRINQLITNTSIAFKNAAATIRATPTTISDFASGSKTTTTRDAQGKIATKSVDKPDSDVNYTYKNGKVDTKTVNHYVDDPNDSATQIWQSQDLYTYDSKGKVNTKKVSYKNDPTKSQDLYTYDSKGKVASLMATTKAGTINTTYYINGKRVANSIAIPDGQGSTKITFPRQRLNALEFTIPNAEVESFLQSHRPVIDPKTGEFIGIPLEI